MNNQTSYAPKALSLIDMYPLYWLSSKGGTYHLSGAFYALNFHNTHINVKINTIYSFLEKRLLWNGFKILCTRMCRVASLDGSLSAH